MPQSLACSVCSMPETEETPIKRCSRCRDRFYCSKECQAKDWRTHKEFCGAVAPTAGTLTAKWYDNYRRCKDGSLHEGNLELITWPCEAEGTGWGHCSAEESDGLRAKFENEFGGDERKLFKYFPEAFRWTCCGTDAGIRWGCDHHGTGSKACTCDFCKMGKSLPPSIYNKQDAARYGLRLPRGPDSRSFDAASAATAAAGRAMFGLDV